MPLFDDPKNTRRAYCSIHLTESISKKLVRIRPDLAAGHSSLLDPTSKALKLSVERFDARIALKELLFEYPIFPFKKNIVRLISMEKPCIHEEKLDPKKATQKMLIGTTIAKSPSSSDVLLAEVITISEAKSRKRSFIEDAMLKAKATPVLGRNWTLTK